MPPLSSSRHHLSNDDCLEDNRENCQNCFLLCYVRQFCTVHTHQQFLKRSVGLGLGLVFVHSFTFSILTFFWFRLDYFVLVLFAFDVLG